MKNYDTFLAEAKGTVPKRLINRFKELNNAGHGHGEGMTFVGNHDEHKDTIEALKSHGLVGDVTRVKHAAVLHHTHLGTKALHSDSSIKSAYDSDTRGMGDDGRNRQYATPYG